MTIRNRFRGTLPVAQWLIGGGTSIESIQYGTVAVSGTSNTATITAVDTTRTVLLHLGASYDISASDLRAANTRIALTNATTVTGVKGTTGDGGTATISFAVIQFRAGVVRPIQRGTITMSGSSNTATITAVNTAKTAVNHLGCSILSNDDRNRVRITLTNATTVTATAGTAGGNSVVSYEVIEWVG